MSELSQRDSFASSLSSSRVSLGRPTKISDGHTQVSVSSQLLQRASLTFLLVDDGTGTLELRQSFSRAQPAAGSNKTKLSKRLSDKAKGKQPEAYPSTGVKPIDPNFDGMIPKWNIGRFTIKIQYSFKNNHRYVNLVEEERVPSAQLELDHWNQVMKNHQITYRESFQIPPQPIPQSPPAPAIEVAETLVHSPQTVARTIPQARVLSKAIKPSAPTSKHVPQPLPLPLHASVSTSVSLAFSSRSLTYVSRVILGKRGPYYLTPLL